MKSSIKIEMKESRIQVMDYLKGYSIFTIALMHLLPMIQSIPSKIITLSSIGGAGVHVFFCVQVLVCTLVILNISSHF